jgi:hypothetical protein
MEKYREKSGGEPMTRKEAKELTLELWRYLAEHPECDRKSKADPAIYVKVENLAGLCPLCELFYSIECVNCPLERRGSGCGDVE